MLMYPCTNILIQCMYNTNDENTVWRLTITVNNLMLISDNSKIDVMIVNKLQIVTKNDENVSMIIMMHNLIHVDVETT